MISLTFSQSRTYWLALLFTVGGVLLPAMCHVLPQGGAVWLPIYFFTLVSAYRYGLHVGLLTALLTPFANHLLTGMPAAGMLAPIGMKSVLLALCAAGIARKVKAVRFWAVALAVLAYQVLGMCGEYALLQTPWAQAVEHVRLGVPGMLLQMFAGYGVLCLLAKKGL